MKGSREREQELLKKISEVVRDASTDDETVRQPNGNYFIVGGDINNITHNHYQGNVVDDVPEVPWGDARNRDLRELGLRLTEMQRHSIQRWIYARCASLRNQSLFVDYCELHFGKALLSQLSDDELLDLEHWLINQSS